MADDLRFLCDEMLSGLGRWLRIAGYDTAIAERGRRDRELVEQAHAEKRILLTRDRRLVEIRRGNDRTIVLECDGIDAGANELAQRLSLDWNRDPLSRCTLCNTRLELADSATRCPAAAEQRLGSTVKVCPRCGHLYWEGSHVRRMRTRLACFACHAAHREEETQAVGELDRPGAPL
jgi:uncharacterized protein